VIHRHGPSIRHEAMFATGVRKWNRPNSTSRSSPILEIGGWSGLTPQNRRKLRDRRPTRIGKLFGGTTEAYRAMIAR
jgi:hypothetical protein